MATKSLTSFIHFGNKVSTKVNRSICSSVTKKCCGREVVGFYRTAEPTYVDNLASPMPPIRYKKVTPEIQVLRNKEKGDWRNLTIEEKKMLYRASFRQTLVEVDTPNNDMKSIIGTILFFTAIGIWLFLLSERIERPIKEPESISEEYRIAQYKRMVALDVNPVSGLAVAK